MHPSFFSPNILYASAAWLRDVFDLHTMRSGPHERVRLTPTLNFDEHYGRCTMRTFVDRK